MFRYFGLPFAQWKTRHSQQDWQGSHHRQNSCARCALAPVTISTWSSSPIPTPTITITCTSTWSVPNLPLNYFPSPQRGEGGPRGTRWEMRGAGIQAIRLPPPSHTACWAPSSPGARKVVDCTIGTIRYDHFRPVRTLSELGHSSFSMRIQPEDARRAMLASCAIDANACRGRRQIDRSPGRPADFPARRAYRCAIFPNLAAA